MSYTRRADLTCTKQEMDEYGSVVLMKNEIIRIKMDDGTYATKRGDGVTPISQLPFELDHELSNVLKASAVGENGIVSFGSISSLNHELQVKVDLQNVADYRDVRVTRYGKNLFYNDPAKVSEITYYTNSGSSRVRMGYSVKLNAGTYTASLVDVNSKYGSRYIYGTLLDKYNKFKQSGLNLFVGETINKLTFKADDGDVFYFYNGSELLNKDVAMALFSSVHIQIELGNRATEHVEDVKPFEYTVTPEGKTVGIEPVQPVTTLVVNYPAKINVFYNVDIPKLNEEIQSVKKDVGDNQAKIRDLITTVDLLKGSQGSHIEGVGTIVKSMRNYDGSWYDGAYLSHPVIHPTEQTGALGLIGKIGGGLLLSDQIVGDDYYTKPFLLKPKSIEILGKVEFSNVIETLEDYGVSDGANYNYIMFGENGVYYVQRVTLDRKQLANIADPYVSLEDYVIPLKKPIITDITGHFKNFDPFFAYDEVEEIRVYADTEDVLPLVPGVATAGQAMGEINVEILFSEVVP